MVVRAKQTDEAEVLAKYPDGGPVFCVQIDCTMGTNSTGIVMREGDEGLLDVALHVTGRRALPWSPRLRGEKVD